MVRDESREALLGSHSSHDDGHAWANNSSSNNNNDNDNDNNSDKDSDDDDCSGDRGVGSDKFPDETHYNADSRRFWVLGVFTVLVAHQVGPIAIGRATQARGRAGACVRACVGGFVHHFALTRPCS
jgi:hypothetical protein